MSNILTDPSPEEARFFVPFEVGTDKIKLYGFPPYMAQKSELIKSMMDVLNTNETTLLATNLDVNRNSLLFVWSRMNNINVAWPSSVDDIIDMWELLNYFDIDYKDQLVNKYISKIFIGHLPSLLSGDDDELLENILGKVKLINPVMYEKYLNIIQQNFKIRPKEKLIITFPNNFQSSLLIDPLIIEKSISSKLPNFQLVIGENGNKRYNVHSGNQTFDMTYPEWNSEQNAYVINFIYFSIKLD